MTRLINKAACRRLAAELRQEMGLVPTEPFDPWAFADLYGIQVVALTALDLEQPARTHFTIHSSDAFSGALLPYKGGAVIIENDTHSLERRRSTMCHELAHVAAEHQFDADLVNEKGCRTADSVQEAEAAEISGELLIPFEAAKKCARLQHTNQQVARQFGVSLDMARWRMDATGARKIAERAAARYAPRSQ